MWYQTEMMMKDRQERMEREANEARMGRVAAGRQRANARPRRLRFPSRS